MDPGDWIGTHKVAAAAGGGVVLALVFAVFQRTRSSSTKAQTAAQYIVPNALISSGGGQESLSVLGQSPLFGSIPNLSPPPTATPADPPPPAPIAVAPQQTQGAPFNPADSIDTSIRQNAVSNMALSSLYPNGLGDTAPGQLNDWTHWTSSATGLPITIDAAGVYHS